MSQMESFEQTWRNTMEEQTLNDVLEQLDGIMKEMEEEDISLEESFHGDAEIMQ